MDQETASNKDSSRISLEFILNFDRQLRAPLSTILGMIDVLKSTSLTNEQRQYVSNLEFASEEMNQLLQNVQMIMESETSKYQLRTDHFHFEDFLKQLHRELRQIESASDTRCSLEVFGDVPNQLVGDRNAIMEIISGLTLFTCSIGKSDTHVELRLTQESSDMLHFKGVIRQRNSHVIGERLRNIFGNSDNGNHMNVFGEKVALPVLLAKSLVKQYHSAIDWTLEDKGLELAFYFHARKASPTGSEALLNNLPSDFRSNARILVVEDIELNQLVTRLMLENYGCTVDIAMNGQQAVELFHHDKYDCVIMDIEMPVMDGIEATRILRKKYGDSVPIIALSADALGRNPESYRKEGFNDYLTKPVKKETLALKIKLWTTPQETVS